MTVASHLPFARRSSTPDAEPAPGAMPVPPGADHFLVVVTDLSGPRFEIAIPGWSHPESEYERRHANCTDGDLRAVPDFTRAAANRFAAGRRGRR